VAAPDNLSKAVPIRRLPAALLGQSTSQRTGMLDRAGRYAPIGCVCYRSQLVNGRSACCHYTNGRGARVDHGGPDGGCCSRAHSYGGYALSEHEGSRSRPVTTRCERSAGPWSRADVRNEAGSVAATMDCVRCHKSPGRGVY